jgi:hypothetical protein
VFVAMATHDAACSCGQLHLTAQGDPVRISICHCLACQRRTGSAFAMQARFPTVEVRVFGRSTEYTRTSDLGEKRTFHFCPECGATVFYTTEDTADVVAIPVGAFADPGFPAPTVSVYESRRHPWLSLSPEIQRNAPELWEPLHPLYEAAEYAEAADRGRELLEAHPGYGDLLYNVACCESLAGRSADALIHLGRALDVSESFRAMATDDADFDPIRSEPGFQNLIGH